MRSACLGVRWNAKNRALLPRRNEHWELRSRFVAARSLFLPFSFPCFRWCRRRVRSSVVTLRQEAAASPTFQY